MIVEAFTDRRHGAHVVLTTRDGDGAIGVLEASGAIRRTISAIIQESGHNRGPGTDGGIRGANVRAAIHTEMGSLPSATLRAAARAEAEAGHNGRLGRLAARLERHGMPLAARRIRREIAPKDRRAEGPIPERDRDGTAH